MPHNLNTDIIYKFKIYFGISVWDYWDKIFGFDIIKFDDFLKTPDNISIRDYITQEYSKEASDLVETLVNISPFKNYIMPI